MLILGINRILEWVQITTNGRRYTCPMKEINGELFFRFKNQWHKVIDYVSDHTNELVKIGEKVVGRKFTK